MADYKVIQDTNYETFASYIRSSISDQWQLAGGVSTEVVHMHKGEISEKVTLK